MRQLKRTVKIGNITIGGTNPIAVQTMLNVPVKDIAGNVEQAKGIIRNYRPDIILCDIEMPQSSGLELLAWCKDNAPETETIILTCHAQFSYAQTAVRLGSLDYLLKPVTEDTLIRVI